MTTYVCMQHCQTEWDAGALENGELTQLRAAYNHQLEEQIALAKLDIVNALQEQIQVALDLATPIYMLISCKKLIRTYPRQI